jgi:hypothetical protein
MATDEQIAAMRDPRSAARRHDKIAAHRARSEGRRLPDRYVVDIIEQLKTVEKRYPSIDRVVCATPLETPLDVQLEDLDRFTKEVMLVFRPAKIATAAE